MIRWGWSGVANRERTKNMINANAVVYYGNIPPCIKEEIYVRFVMAQLCPISLMDRISGYEPEDVSSILMWDI